MNKKPLVTAVMVTGMHKARYVLARTAIRCFNEQTYQEKELLIINHGNISLQNGEKTIREIRVCKSKNETIGDLRNIGLDEARGDFIIIWDDDDWYAPRRIEVQLAAQTKDAAVVLKSQMRFSLLNSCAFYQNSPGGFCGTILHPRTVPFRYPSMIRGSDTIFKHSFKGNLIILDNDPSLYIRIYHGLNLWDARHMMHGFASLDIQNQLKIKEEHKIVLRQMLLQNRSAYEQFDTLRKEAWSQNTAAVSH